MISVALPASFRRIASSTAISSNGFIDILMLASSTPEPSVLTRILTLKSTTRFTGTKIFMIPYPGPLSEQWGRKLKAAPLACQRLCCGAPETIDFGLGPTGRLPHLYRWHSGQRQTDSPRAD